MKNVEELRSQLSEVFQQLKTGTLDANQAGEFANIAGKMISSAKAQLEYYALRKEKPVIGFLKSSDESNTPDE